MILSLRAADSPRFNQGSPRAKCNGPKILFVFDDFDYGDEYRAKRARDFEEIVETCRGHEMDCELVHTTNDMYQMTGERVTSYSAVIIVDGAEREHDKYVAECFKYYAEAPLVYYVWAVGEWPEPEQRASLFQQFEYLADKTIEGDGQFIQGFLPGQFANSGTTQAMIDLINLIIETYRVFEDSDVRPAFNKFDEDGSGAIDVGELHSLLTSLGQNIEPETVRKYMGDLDVNGDGTIDYEEFRDWFLSGFKTQSGIAGQAKKLMGNMRKLQAELVERSDELAACMEGKGSKLVKRSVCLQLNKIEDVKSWVKARLNLIGKDYYTEIQKAYDFITENFEEPQGEERVVYGELDLPFNIEMEEEFVAGIKALEELGIDFDYDFCTVEGCVKIRFATQKFDSMLPPPLPPFMIDKLSKFNQVFEVAMEFAEAPFEFPGENNIFFPGSLYNFVEQFLDKNRGFRIKANASMAKGLIKVMKEMDNASLNPPGYMLALLSANANLTVNYDQAADVLNAPWFRELCEKFAGVNDELQGKHPHFFKNDGRCSMDVRVEKAAGFVAQRKMPIYKMLNTLVATCPLPQNEELYAGSGKIVIEKLGVLTFDIQQHAGFGNTLAMILGIIGAKV